MRITINNVNFECDFDPTDDQKNIIWQKYQEKVDSMTLDPQKEYFRKVLENLYIDFLANKWTPILRQYNLIPPDYTITVDNTGEEQNVQLLMTLRAYNFSAYDIMAGEFDRLKRLIIANGGVMAYVQFHVL